MHGLRSTIQLLGKYYNTLSADISIFNLKTGYDIGLKVKP